MASKSKYEEWLDDFKMHEVPKDGKCFWNAVSAALAAQGGPKLQVGKLKAIIAEHMRQHGDVCAKYTHNKAPTAKEENVKDFTEYLMILTSSESSGSDIEMLAAARKFDCPILLFSDAGEGKAPKVSVFHRGGKKKPLAMYYKERHFEWLEGTITKDMILDSDCAQPEGQRGGGQGIDDEFPPPEESGSDDDNVQAAEHDGVCTGTWRGSTIHIPAGGPRVCPMCKEEVAFNHNWSYF